MNEKSFLKSSVEEIEKEISQEFLSLDSWDEKYEHIIELGKKLKAFSEENKNDSNKVKGCQSNVWLYSEFNSGKLILFADSDSLIVKGLASLLIRVLSERVPEEILNANISFIDSIGLRENLAQSRSNGLFLMLERIKRLAKEQLPDR